MKMQLRWQHCFKWQQQTSVVVRRRSTFLYFFDVGIRRFLFFVSLSCYHNYLQRHWKTQIIMKIELYFDDHKNTKYENEIDFCRNWAFILTKKLSSSQYGLWS